MVRIHSFLRGGGLVGMALLCGGVASAQTLLIASPRTSASATRITFDLAVDQGVGTAVSWGTDITLVDTGVLRFVSNTGGPNLPFLNKQSFFDTDFSDYSKITDGVLHLSFLNTTPGAILGNNNYVVLGQFQVDVLTNPGLPGSAITLSPLGFPPDASAVQDEGANNLLIAVNGTRVTAIFPSPEPSGWMLMLGGLAGVGLLKFRRHK